MLKLYNYDDINALLRQLQTDVDGQFNHFSWTITAANALKCNTKEL